LLKTLVFELIETENVSVNKDTHGRDIILKVAFSNHTPLAEFLFIGWLYHREN